MTTIEERLSVPAGPLAADEPVPARTASVNDGRGYLLYAVPATVGLIGVVVAVATILINATDIVITPLLLLLGIGLAVAIVAERIRTGGVHLPVVLLEVLALAAAIGIGLLPEWLFGGNVNGVVHRTVLSGPALFVLSLASVVVSIRRLFRASPSGQDLGLVPVLLAPMLVGLIGFALVLGRIIGSGLGSFKLELLFTAWHQASSSTGPAVGYLNNILGTFLLVGLTLLFAVLPGVGAGVFMAEYPGRIAAVIRFCATMLRAIAVFIVGATAAGVVHLASVNLDSDSFASLVIRGGFDDGTRVQAEKGSFVLAAFFLALLVMPVIARLTEEGLRSIPREMREGSVALGATDGYGLRRIHLPWAAPNIVTALILAGAEAAGGLAVIVFMASPGEHGVGLFNSVTSLDYAVFAARYGPRVYWNSMLPYQDTAALLLLVLTIGLTLAALVLQRRFARRYRASITAD